MTEPIMYEVVIEETLEGGGTASASHRTSLTLALQDVAADVIASEAAGNRVDRIEIRRWPS